MMSVDISFILLTWNSEIYIENCLNSLLNDLSSSCFSHEIFIVDNGSKDETKSIIHSFHKKHPKNIIPIFMKSNRGTTYPRNVALKKARGKYIGIIDCDVEIPTGTVSELIRSLDEDENSGIVSPKLLYPNGNLQKSTDVLPTILSKLRRYFFLRKIEKKENNLNFADNVYEVDYAVSAVWVLKRELLQKVGLLDEKIFYAPEDVDYCLRVWLSGYKVLYNPLVTVVHHCQEISRGPRINKATISHIKGLVYFFMKHKYLLKPPRIR